MCNTVPAVSPSATGTKLFIGNLPLSATADGLRDVASAYGTVEEVVVLHRTSPSGNRCGFVRFSDAASASQARTGISASCYPGAEVMMVARFADRTRATRAGSDTSSDLTKLFVGNLQNDVTESDLWAMFAPYGEVMEVVLMRKASISGCRCAFVRFNYPSAAGAAVDSLHGMKNGAGVPLVVRIADPTKAAEMSMMASSGSNAASTGFCSAPSLISHTHSSPLSNCSTPPPDASFALSDTDTLSITPPSSPGLSHQLRRGVPMPVPQDTPFLLPVPMALVRSQGARKGAGVTTAPLPQFQSFSLTHQPYGAAPTVDASIYSVASRSLTNDFAFGYHTAASAAVPFAKSPSTSSPTRWVSVHNPYSFAAFDEYEAEF